MKPKYKLGQTVYRIDKAIKDIKCPLCDGDRYITVKFKNRDIRIPCPRDHEGLDKTIRSAWYFVYDNRYTVTDVIVTQQKHLDLSTSKTKTSTEISYKLDCGYNSTANDELRKENDIFSSMEAAEKECDRLNKLIVEKIQNNKY